MCELGPARGRCEAVECISSLAITGSRPAGTRRVHQVDVCRERMKDSATKDQPQPGCNGRCVGG